MSSTHRNNRSCRTGDETDRHGEFLRLYTKYQHRILAYIFVLVPNRTDTEDILQETAVLLWEKFDQFQAGTDFAAWACRVAFLIVSNHRKRFTRSKLIFSDDLLAAVADRALEMTPHLDDRREALQECLKRLDDRDRRMVTARYEPRGDARRAAEASGRTLQATYKALYRIRKALFDCVTLRVAEGKDR
ncbi:MAG: sigma-70 family RNA polymerase sigma factor [Pirellulaceae bacterium]|nr:sigma-70 family RNA polymerase sigma factor [Pirellulaceae bacterium]